MFIALKEFINNNMNVEIIYIKFSRFNYVFSNIY